jgi:phospholipase/carboxylesterase
MGCAARPIRAHVKTNEQKQLSEDTSRESDGDAIMNAVMALVPPLLEAMDALGFIGRHLHPPHLAELVGSVGTPDENVRMGLQIFASTDWPERLQAFRQQIETAADAACKAFDGLRAAAADPNGVIAAYRAMRYYSRAIEALYPVSYMLPPVGLFFLEPGARQNAALAAKIESGDPTRDNVGVMHSHNEKGMRGGFSLYVPEYYDGATPMPVIMALHGGSGHGRDFLWSWIREARSRGAIVISPTSIGDTWSLMEGDVDRAHIERILAHVREHWNVDGSHMLLTGMSDGGTFSYVSGLVPGSPFTHLAPVAASFHPFLLETTSAARITGLPIYLVHGKLDWMFPIDMARVAHRTLVGAGAAVTYREIADLSHTYPRDENGRIMDWLLGTA